MTHVAFVTPTNASFSWRSLACDCRFPLAHRHAERELGQAQPTGLTLFLVAHEVFESPSPSIHLSEQLRGPQLPLA